MPRLFPFALSRGIAASGNAVLLVFGPFPIDAVVRGFVLSATSNTLVDVFTDFAVFEHNTRPATVAAAQAGTPLLESQVSGQTVSVQVSGRDAALAGDVVGEQRIPVGWRAAEGGRFLAVVIDAAGALNDLNGFLGCETC